ncbi:type I secretion system permease/ATPase [Sulfitobacter sp. TBRI5]|uniref:type I secretion system permease/ATPase n=1 Tax=Sulfitobacter sp. TBRI5 TaxID=2989732 RepID=UPI003D9B06DE
MLGLEAVAWMAKVFDRPLTPHTVAARIPRDTDMASLSGLARAFAAIGLKSRAFLKDIAKLDSVVLPALMLRKKGGVLIVTRISAKEKRATVVDPAAAGLEQDMTFSALRRLTLPEILLVTPDEDRAHTMLSPEAVRLAPRKGHWFWAPVGANWQNWAQITVAALLLNLMSLALPLFVMNVYDKVIPNLAYVTLWTLAIGVGIALALDLMLRTIRGNILENVSRRVDLKVAASLFNHAMHARLLGRPGGAAGIASTLRDFEVVRDFFASATFVAVVDLMFIGIFIAALYFIVGPIALVPLCAVPVVIVLAILAQIPIGRAAGRAQQMAMKRHTVLIEALSGVETIKTLNAEPLMQREWENAVAASSQVNGRTKFWSSIASNGTMMIQQVVSVLIIVWGVFLVSDGKITIGGLIAANILAGRVLAPLGTIAQTIFRAQYAFKALSALNSFMGLPLEQEAVVTSDAQITKGAVALKNVRFSYPEVQVSALNDLTFSVGAGECVALLGRVGSGKTTTGKVLSGLIRADSGTVLIDGVALDQYDPAELRRGVGYLPQAPDLFTGTLRENLTLGNARASDEEIKRAFYYAAMDEFLAAVPEGLDLFIGEQGRRLSGGQRQGVALARLLLRYPKMLFLDEPTNAMDQRMQGQIIQRLGELNRAGTGMMICTHRQSLAAMAGRLIVMDQGRVVLDGRSDEVLDKLRSMGTAQGKRS